MEEQDDLDTGLAKLVDPGNKMYVTSGDSIMQLKLR